MEQSILQIQNITIKDLEEVIKRIIQESIPSNVATKDILTRQEVMELLDITPVTLRNWSKKGTLQTHNIEGRAYYYREEIDNALIPQKNQKSRRAE